ncbi:acyl-CoA-binding protein [uncultured Tenacibaculum sp.]|uniref:acyl-CoA-binding protein n=1 Tax=uncultured Tenacibaculum sp. TaxID=174713 RepID=UPI00262F8111|nr:acyl-CoA-binding protein [uncultured Tenacibaculum sp.]
MTSDLDTLFSDAFERANNTTKKFAPDVQLRLYAYYKQATKGDNFSYNNEDNLKNAFKFNAWIQLKGMDENEAKENYIKLVNSILK